MSEKCKHGATQNSNESFHNIIWSMCRKTTSPLNLAVNLAIAQFNVVKYIGLRNILNLKAVTSESAGPRCIAVFVHLDATRLCDCISRSTAKVKRRRQHLDLLRSREEDAAIEAEGGPSYAPGLAEQVVDIQARSQDFPGGGYFFLDTVVWA